MVGESYLLEKAGSKHHANCTLECPVLTLKSNYLDRWPNDCVEVLMVVVKLHPLTHAQFVSQQRGVDEEGRWELLVLLT